MIIIVIYCYYYCYFIFILFLGMWEKGKISVKKFEEGALQNFWNTRKNSPPLKKRCSRSLIREQGFEKKPH